MCEGVGQCGASAQRGRGARPPVFWKALLISPSLQRTEPAPPCPAISHLRQKRLVLRGSSPGHLPQGRQPELTCRLEPALPCLAAGGGAALGRTLSPAVPQTGAWRGADAARQSAVLTVATLPGGQR